MEIKDLNNSKIYAGYEHISNEVQRMLIRLGFRGQGEEGNQIADIEKYIIINQNEIRFFMDKKDFDKCEYKEIGIRRIREAYNKNKTS